MWLSASCCDFICVVFFFNLFGIFWCVRKLYSMYTSLSCARYALQYKIHNDATSRCGQTTSITVLNTANNLNKKNIEPENRLKMQLYTLYCFGPVACYLFFLFGNNIYQRFMLRTKLYWIWPLKLLLMWMTWNRNKNVISWIDLRAFEPDSSEIMEMW